MQATLVLKYNAICQRNESIDAQIYKGTFFLNKTRLTFWGVLGV
jgi:hypothetical protein